VRISVLAILLAAFAARLNAGVRPEDVWLQQIGKEVGTTCQVKLSKVGTVIAGNNGLRSEQWFVKTCTGNAEYRVEYFPPAFFPSRKSPYQVTRVKLSESANK
jgi:hypothetical protein